jgi:UDP-glucose-4-epimerase GalE
VFGEPEYVPLDEAHPQRPINAYGETKLAVERALPHIERAHGIQWVTLRYFNAAGADPDGRIGEAHDPEEHLIPRALAATEGGRALTVFGEDYPTADGTCVRDYVHVADLATAHIAALQRLEQGGGSAAFNLGSGVGMSVRQVIDAVGRIAGRPVRHVVGPRRPGDPARLVASNARARADLGWAPALGDLDTIVRTAWQWHRAHPHGYR